MIYLPEFLYMENDCNVDALILVCNLAICWWLNDMSTQCWCASCFTFFFSNAFILLNMNLSRTLKSLNTFTSSGAMVSCIGSSVSKSNKNMSLKSVGYTLLLHACTLFSSFRSMSEEFVMILAFVFLT